MWCIFLIRETLAREGLRALRECAEPALFSFSWSLGQGAPPTSPCQALMHVESKHFEYELTTCEEALNNSLTC